MRRGQSLAMFIGAPLLWGIHNCNYYTLDCIPKCIPKLLEIGMMRLFFAGVDKNRASGAPSLGLARIICAVVFDFGILHNVGPPAFF